MENIGKEESRNWSDLHHDLVVLIARKIQYVNDFFVFGSVCATWRSAATKDNFNGVCQHPWLLQTINNKHRLSASQGGSDPSVIAYTLPENITTVCLGWKGWLLVVENPNAEMSLLHILSRTRIRLPSKKSLYFCTEDSYIVQKAALSSDPFLNPSGFSVMIIYGNDSVAAFWRPGDETYTLTWICRVRDIVFYNGLFHLITREGAIAVFDGDTGRGRKVAGEMCSSLRSEEFHLYLVESDGRLLMVERTITREETWFQVYVFEFEEWWEIKDVGNRAIFVGLNASFSVEACEFLGCKANRIYFTDDANSFATRGYKYREHHYMGVYSLTDDKVEYSRCCESGACRCSRPSLWVTPFL